MSDIGTVIVNDTDRCVWRRRSNDGDWIIVHGGRCAGLLKVEVWVAGDYVCRAVNRVFSTVVVVDRGTLCRVC